MPCLRNSSSMGLISASCFFVVSAGVFIATDFSTFQGERIPINDVVLLGRKFLDYGSEGYVLPFEIISLLLLSVMIGGIIIATISYNSLFWIDGITCIIAAVGLYIWLKPKKAKARKPRAKKTIVKKKADASSKEDS